MHRAGHTEGGEVNQPKKKKKKKTASDIRLIFFYFLVIPSMLDFLFPPLFLFSRSNKTAGLCTLELARRENKGERSERKRERERDRRELHSGLVRKACK